MRGYDPADWEPFFTALIAAAAALTGLLFVAVSINLNQILEHAKFLPARAAETLSTLLLVVVSSALALIPQSTRLLGVEIVILVVPMLVITVWRQVSYRRQNHDDPLLWTISRIISTATATVPGALAGLSLAGHWGGGFYWLAAAALLGILGASYNAWILLIEITR
jgi:modulator of FtsH protease